MMTTLRSDIAPAEHIEIVDQIHRYCRALDRMDVELMGTVFHDDATIHYPGFEGSWHGLVEWVWDLHRHFDSHSHQVSNIALQPGPALGAAVSESYVTATLWRFLDPEPLDAAAGPSVTRADTSGESVGVWARYLDRWLRRDSRWAIAHRQCVVDIKTVTPTVGGLGKGRRDKDDPSYGYLR